MAVIYCVEIIKKLITFVFPYLAPIGYVCVANIAKLFHSNLQYCGLAHNAYPYATYKCSLKNNENNSTFISFGNIIYMTTKICAVSRFLLSKPKDNLYTY